MNSSITIALLTIGSTLAVWWGFGSAGSQVTSISKPISHDLWNEVLIKYVSVNGNVNYKGLKDDRKQFDDYLKLLSSSHPNKSWSNDEQMAYWINAYNAFTVDLILKHYPIKSIRDIGGLVKIPGIQSAWDIKFIKIEGKEYTLGNIEHDILRKQFNNPEIHFAINCASYSCPKLNNEAFTSENLGKQLAKSAKDFINDTTKNKVTPGKLELSKIFDWYKGDFTKEGSLITFIAKYSAVKINSEAKISYLEYNWNLNE